jgi:hypothetical protein
MSFFKDVEELKAFLVWAKGEKIKALQVGSVKVEFHELAMVGDLPELTNESEEPKNRTNPNISADGINVPDETDSEEDLLFHSAE